MVAGLAENSVLPVWCSPNSATWKTSGFPFSCVSCPHAAEKAGSVQKKADLCHTAGYGLMRVCMTGGNDL